MPTSDPLEMIDVYVGPTAVALKCRCGARWAEDNLRIPPARVIALADLIKRAQQHIRSGAHDRDIRSLPSPTPARSAAAHDLAIVAAWNRGDLEEHARLLTETASAFEAAHVPHPGEAWWWPTDCQRCPVPIAPWDPNRVGSAMTHIRPGGGAHWEANADHRPVYIAACNAPVYRCTGPLGHSSSCSHVDPSTFEADHG